MNQYSISKMKWGTYRININDTYYTSYYDIPIELYQTFQNIKDYNITNIDTEEELRGFIIQRLFDKYYNMDMIIKIRTEMDIHKLYNNNEFIIHFINFLKNQNIIDVMCVIENNIVNASRPNITINEWGVVQRIGDPSLVSDGIIRTENRLKLEEMDCYIKILWNKIITIATDII